MDFLAASGQQLLILALAGAAAGLLAGLFGIGGGLVVVPVVYWVMQGMGVESTLAMPVAITTSLVTIVPTALSSTRAHHRLLNVDWPLVRRLAPALLTGVLIGSQLVAHLRSDGLVIFFGLFLLLVAIKNLWRDNRRAYVSGMPAIWIQWLCAALVGGVSAVAGVGGGAIGVPLLTAAGIPVHRAIGSCAAFGFGIASLGALGVVFSAETPAAAPAGTWRLIYWPALITLVPLTVFMAPIGAKIGKKLSPELLRKCFTVVLVLTSFRMLYSVWG